MFSKTRGSPELVAGATVPLDHAELDQAVNRPRPPSCSSRRDEAVAADRVAVGARTKPHAPREVTPVPARVIHAPPPSSGGAAREADAPPFAGAAVPDHRPSATGKPPPPPERRRVAAVAGDRRVDRLGSELTGLTFDQRVDYLTGPPDTRFNPFESRSDSEFLPDFRFGVYLKEQRLAGAAHSKSGKAPESQRRGGNQSGLPRCPRCHRSHSGQCTRCHLCGKLGHIASYCRVKPVDATPIRQIAAPVAPPMANMNCFGCNQPGHVVRDCPRRGNVALPPPPKRPAIAPRVFAVGEPQGAEPIAENFRVGSVLVGGEPAHTLFDTGASHSFVSPHLVQSWSFRGVFEPVAKHIQTAGTEKLGAVGIHRDVPVMLGGVDFRGDLTEMEMSYYDAILGMDWLSRHQVVLDCPRARVNIPRPEGKIVFQGIQTHLGVSVVSMLRAEDLLERGS
ncbi:hypothetical protein N665_0532s0078 [Sinapis alba]|nr:hypothetical protein N665_0532s0078 [Sinapis alba]